MGKAESMVCSSGLAAFLLLKDRLFMAGFTQSEHTGIERNNCMATPYPLDVVTPERVLLHEDVVETTAPGTEGYLGILAHHAPIMTELAPGEVRVTLADGRTVARLVISGGFLEMSQEGRATILADRAERADEIDMTRAEADLAAARQMLETAELGSSQQTQARNAVAEAESRVRVARGSR